MVEVGIRELKSRLSYFVQLMQAGETIAIKVRDHVVGFLTEQAPSKNPEEPSTNKKLKARIRELEKEGFLRPAKKGRLRPFKPVKLKDGLSSTEIIRQMRDESW